MKNALTCETLKTIITLKLCFLPNESLLNNMKKQGMRFKDINASLKICLTQNLEKLYIVSVSESITIF
jgi:hypothetical protein